MNKTMEYMAFELPVVAFDLRETRVSAGDAAVYVTPTGSPEQDVRDYAKAIVDLIDDAGQQGADGQARPGPGRGKTRLAPFRARLPAAYTSASPDRRRQAGRRREGLSHVRNSRAATSRPTGASWPMS